jgi:hypothetical protein
MELVDHVSVLTSVELVDVDIALRSTCEEMTTVRESNLSASLDSNVMKWFETLLEHVHHSHSISETNNDMESRRMECHTVGLIVVGSADLESWSLVLTLIIPNSHSLIDGAGCNQIFLDADVHTLNSS